MKGEGVKEETKTLLRCRVCHKCLSYRKGGAENEVFNWTGLLYNVVISKLGVAQDVVKGWERSIQQSKLKVVTRKKEKDILVCTLLSSG